jgi:predicted negative regulator of RcsB-dependent stress response
MAEEKSKVPVATLEYEPTSFEQTLLKHKSKLILVGVLAVAGAVGYWGWRLTKDSKHHSAAVDFTRAGSVEDLKKVAKEHPGETAAGDAMILAADKLFTDNKGSDAIALLKDFLSQYPEHPLKDLASWRLAEYLAAGGDIAAATPAYETVSQSNSPFSGLAMLRLGDIKWGAGENEKAREYYDKILRNPAMTGNPARTEAQERIDVGLKWKPPTPVEYVAPLLPPPKIDQNNNRGRNAFPMGDNPSDISLPGGTKLPEGIKFDEEETPFVPPVPGSKDINSPGLLDEPPSIPPPPVPSSPPPSGESNPPKGTPVPAKPAPGGQP